MKRTIRKMTGCLLGVGLMAVPMVASAEWDRITDELTFSGAYCTFTSSSATSGQNRQLAKLQNTSGSTAEAVCPLTRRRTIDRARNVSALVSSAVDPYTCLFHVRRFTNGTTETREHTGTNNLSGNMQVLWNLGTNGYNVGDNSSVAISCNLPQGSAIYTYHFDSLDLYRYF